MVDTINVITKAEYDSMLGWSVGYTKVAAWSEYTGPVVGERASYIAGKNGLLNQNTSSKNNVETSFVDNEVTWEQAGISKENAVRIQNAADKTKQTIIVVGSRANGTAGLNSDWDYYVTGNSKQRHSAWSSLPRGLAGGEQGITGQELGIDFFVGYPASDKFIPLDITKPYVIFSPE